MAARRPSSTRREAIPASRSSAREGITLRVSWDAIAGLTPVAANAFLYSIVTDQQGRVQELILNVGYLASPPTSGTPEEQIEQVRRLGAIASEVKPIIRLTFSADRARELLQVTQAMVAIFDAEKS